MKKENASGLQIDAGSKSYSHLLDRKNLRVESEEKIIDPSLDYLYYPSEANIPETRQPNLYIPYQPKKTDYASTAIQKLIFIPSPLIKKHNLLLKRTIDILFSFLAIVILFPWLLPLLAVFIRSNSKGPVFFLQKRHKRNGAVFSCIKFRTMIVNKEADLRSTFCSDERITSVGVFLRRYHLDELPQLFNVLLGDMSLIGPRPHMISENEIFQNAIKEYRFRNEIKPGITGLAQSLGNFGSIRDVSRINDRLLLDLFYIKHWSLKMDIEIILRTIRRTITNKKT
jgi:putative colanic acid biosynthesis UDP-glucose lipid carrier transferase